MTARPGERLCAPPNGSQLVVGQHSIAGGLLELGSRRDRRQEIVVTGCMPVEDFARKDNTACA